MSKELVKKNGVYYVTIQDLPCSSDVQIHEVESGITVNEILKKFDLLEAYCTVQVQGVPCVKDDRASLIPAEGDIINIICIPEGGGGKDIGRTFASILLIGAASFIVGPAVLGLSGWQAGLAKGIILTLGSSLIPPPKQPNYTNNVQQSDPRALSIGAASNSLQPYGIVPVPFGKRKCYPVYGAIPYTELEGQDQYVNMLLLVGYGRCEITNIKIGETDIDDYSDVTYEVLEGYPGEDKTDFNLLYPYDVNEADELNTRVSKGGGAVTRTTNADIDEIRVNLAFPKGLVKIGVDDGERYDMEAQIKIEYAVTGSGSWTEATTLTITDNSVYNVRQGYKFSVTRGQYDVRLTKLTADQTIEGWKDECYWTFLQDAVYETPVTLDDVSAIAIRIKATDQLSGVPDEVNCIYERYLPVWQFEATDISCLNSDQSFNSTSTDFTSYFSVNDFIQVSGFTTSGNNANPKADVYSLKVTAVTSSKLTVSDPRSGSSFSLTDEAAGDTVYFWKEEKTRNPAWTYTSILRSNMTKSPTSDDRIQLSSINTFATNCTTEGRKFDEYVTSAETEKDLMDDILAVGRASFGMESGKYSVIEDKEQTTPVQVITNCNSWNFETTYEFVEKVHALKIRFQNEDEDYIYDERIIYNTGYSASDATKFDEVTLRGCVDADQIWKYAQYMFAVAEHRPSKVYVTMDFEHLAIDKRGTKVLLNHDVLLKGLDSARVTGVTLNGGGDCTAISFENEFTTELAKSYAVTVRKSDFTVITHAVNTPGIAGGQTSLTFSTPIASGQPQPEVGDIVMFGESGSVTANFIVSEIKPAKNQTARLTLLPEGSPIYSADSGSIPAWTPNVTAEAENLRNKPQKPQFYNIRSDETCLKRQGYTNSFITRVFIDVKHPVRYTFRRRKPPEYIQARYRRSGESQFTQSDFFPAQNNTIILEGLQDGIAYSLAIRYVTKDFQASNWEFNQFTDPEGNTVSPTNYTVIGKSNNPNDITDFAATIEGEKIACTWTKVVDLDVLDYEIRYSQTNNWASATNIIRTGDTDRHLLPALTAGTWYIMIKAVDVAGNYSDTENTVTLIIAKPLRPEDVGSRVVNARVQLKWTDCKSDNGFLIDYYKVYRGTENLDFANAVQIGISKSTLKSHDEPVPGSRFYYIVGVDIAGNESDTYMATYLTTLVPQGVGKLVIANLSFANKDYYYTKYAEIEDCLYTCINFRDYSGLPDIGTTFEDLFIDNNATTFQDLIDAGFEKFVEPLTAHEDIYVRNYVVDKKPSGAFISNPSNCFVQEFAISIDAGGDYQISEHLKQGDRVVLDYILEAVSGLPVNCIPFIRLSGYDLSNSPLEHYIFANDVTVPDTFKSVYAVIIKLFFFPQTTALPGNPDGSGIAKISNFKAILTYNELNEKHTVNYTSGAYSLTTDLFYNRFQVVNMVTDGSSPHFHSIDNKTTLLSSYPTPPVSTGFDLIVTDENGNAVTGTGLLEIIGY